MNDLTKHQQQQIQQEYAQLQEFSEPESSSTPNLMNAVLRRWYIVLLTFLLISGVGIPIVWHMIKPQHLATAIVQIAPAVSPILFTDDETGELAMHDNLADQATLITRDQVLQRVADLLADKNLKFFTREERNDYLFEKPISPMEAIKQAISKGIITVTPRSRSELIEVTVKSDFAEEAEQIANAFLTAYMAIEGTKINEGRERKLQLLEDEQKQYADRMKRKRETIRQMAEEFGSTELTLRQEMMLASVGVLRGQLTQLETNKLTLEARIEFLEKTKDRSVVPADLLERRQVFIQNDPLMQSLPERVAQMRQDLIAAKQTLSEDNPELKLKTELLESFEAALEKRRQDLEKIFDENITKQSVKNKDDELAGAKSELESLATTERILKANLEEANNQTIGVGRKHLDIGEEQEQLALIKETYDKIRKSIQMLEMERKRDPRLTTYPASSVLAPNKRIKFTAAILFGSLACGMFLAFLRDKADKSLHTPDDIIRCIGVPVIGTTTRTEQLDKTLLLEHIAYDYQTIRTNLRLLNDGEMPKTLVITSPGMGEGKTTLSINLASSLAQAGNKVLLIDGDLRKPDIAHVLNLPKDSWGLPDVLLGLARFEEAIHTLRLTGLDVLVTNRRNNAAGIEQIARPETANIIKEISRNYDNVIIDTSPVLATPDALLWAKMADAVVLSSLAGQSIGYDLKETLERMAQVNVKILGNVLSNVSAKYSYHRYGYGYGCYGGNGSDTKGKSSSASSKPLLLSIQSQSNKTDEAGS
jgi:capsular exopolysaccharide synthesis family protein